MKFKSQAILIQFLLKTIILYTLNNKQKLHIAKGISRTFVHSINSLFYFIIIFWYQLYVWLSNANQNITLVHKRSKVTISHIQTKHVLVKRVTLVWSNLYKRGVVLLKFHTHNFFWPKHIGPTPSKRQISLRSRRRRRVLWRKVNAEREDSNNSFCATSAHHRKRAHQHAHYLSLL